MKKKIISIILCLLLALGLVSVSEAAGSCYVYASQSTLYRGNTFTVTVGISGGELVKSIGFTPSFDSSLLEYKGYTWLVDADIRGNYDGSTINIAWSSETPVNGNLLQFTFRVKDGAAFTSTSITFTPLMKNGTTVIASNAGSASVSIECSHSWGGWVTDYEADCTNQGKQHRTCDICAETDTRYTAANGHSFLEWTVAVEPTCTEKGTKKAKCSVCGYEESQYIDPLGHELDENAEIIREATCVDSGEKRGVCKRCGQTASIETPLAPHPWGEWIDTVPASCTEKGERTHICTYCGLEESEESMPLGHDFTNGNLVREANIFTEGLFEAKCSRCDASGSIITPPSCTDSAEGIYFETTSGSFEQGSEISVSRICDSSSDALSKGLFKKWVKGFELTFGKIKSWFFKDDPNKAAEGITESDMEKLYGGLRIFEIKAVSGEKEVQPKSPVLLKIPLAEGFSRNIAVYISDENGNMIELPSVVDYGENKTVSVSLSTLGHLAMADLDTKNLELSFSDLDAVQYIVEILLALLLILFIALYALGRKKKKNAIVSEAPGTPDDCTDISDKIVENKLGGSAVPEITASLETSGGDSGSCDEIADAFSLDIDDSAEVSDALSSDADTKE